MRQVTSTSVKQFTLVYHIEYGKGRVVSVTPKGRDALVMVYFKAAKVHDWVLLSSLQRDTDPLMSLYPLDNSASSDQVNDTLQAALENLLGGGFK